MSVGTRVLGVLGGRDLAPGQVERWLRWADRVVAADRGADLCRAAGREPDQIVGDLDSIADRSGLVPDLDQDTSDADKLLLALAREGRAAATLIGVEGDRLDHVLATLYSCARSEVRCRLILRRGYAEVLRAPAELRRNVPGRLSLLPLGICDVTLSGVRWPVSKVRLDPLGLVSLSNAALPDSEVTLTVHEGVAALFVEQRDFEES